MANDPPKEEGGKMSTAKPQLVTATVEEVRALRAPHIEEQPGGWYEAIKMTAQKALSPSVSVSPAVIGLVITIVIQTVIIVWWAASISKDNDANAKKVEKLQSDLETQKVYIDDIRGKYIKMETLMSALQSESQLKQLLREEKEKGK
jgi:hypothetical protein